MPEKIFDKAELIERLLGDEKLSKELEAKYVYKSAALENYYDNKVAIIEHRAKYELTMLENKFKKEMALINYNP